MKIRLGDFYPRVEWGWPTDPARRCHKLGAHAIELQGGIGVARVAARAGMAEEALSGLRRIEHASEQLSTGLPETKGVATTLKNRSKALIKLVEPYRNLGPNKPLPKKLAGFLDEQLLEMGGYEFRLEAESLRACGAPLSGAHGGPRYGPDLKDLPKVPKELTLKSKKQAAENDRVSAARSARMHAEMDRDIKRFRAQRKQR